MLRGAGPWWQQTFEQVPIYQDRRLRLVVIDDYGINYRFITEQAVLMVLKPHSANPFQPLDGPHVVDASHPAVELSIDFSQGGSSADRTGGPYLVRSTPAYQTAIRSLRHQQAMIATGQPVPHLAVLPALGQSVSLHLLVLDGKVHILARDRSPEPGSIILVFHLSSSGHIVNECALERIISPSKKQGQP